MQTFIIEREIPGAADLSPAELAGITSKSNDVVAGLDVPYTWVTSYVAGDKIYCVHQTESEENIREHAARGGFPADRVTVVSTQIGPDYRDA